MNFLSHFHHAHHSLDNPAYCLGLVYPDIKSRDAPQTDPDLLAGCAEHHALDECFHASDWFTKGQAILSKRFPRVPAIRLAGHVALELALDYLLIETDAVYIHGIEAQLNGPSLEAVYARDRPAEAIVRTILRTGRLRSYGTLEGCAEALCRTLARANGHQPGSDQEWVQEAIQVAVGYARRRPLALK